MKQNQKWKNVFFIHFVHFIINSLSIISCFVQIKVLDFKFSLCLLHSHKDSLPIITRFAHHDHHEEVWATFQIQHEWANALQNEDETLKRRKMKIDREERKAYCMHED